MNQNGTFFPIARGERESRWAEEFCSEKEYADPVGYMQRRMTIFETWGPPIPQGGSILQFGIGDGLLAALLAERGYVVTGCDIHPELLDKARQRFVHLGVRADVRLVDINQRPLPFDERYDLVVAVMRHYYKYVRDPVGTLQELRRLTRIKLIIDYNPRKVAPHVVEGHFCQAGLTRIATRAFLTPSRRKLPTLIQRCFHAIETKPWLCGFLLRYKFHRWVMAAPE